MGRERKRAVWIYVGSMLACSFIKYHGWKKKKKKKKKSINHSFLDGYFKYLAEIVLIWVSAVFSANTRSPCAHTQRRGAGGPAAGHLLCFQFKASGLIVHINMERNIQLVGRESSFHS